MENEPGAIVEILRLCVSIDQRAVKIYRSFVKTCDDRELKTFWSGKAREEAKHVSLWKKLIQLAERGAVPNIFDEPLRIKEELKSIISSIDALFQSIDCRDLNRSFLLALRMEFYALHPAFATLFRLVNDMQVEKLPEEHYGEHLKDFFEIIKSHDALSPELEFISETILHLWRDNERLAIETNTDGLTKILNRKGFFYAMRPLSYLAQRNRFPVAIAMADIDDFKKVNDEYGHQAGDETLVRVADLIKTNIRKSDIAGRYGGEEFCIFTIYSEEVSLVKMAEKIRKAVEDGTKSATPVTISIGIGAGFIEKDADREVDQLIRRADECLYEAKSSGKNRVVVR